MTKTLQEVLQDDLAAIRANSEKATADLNTHFRGLKTEVEGMKASDTEARAKHDAKVAEYAELAKSVQELSGAVDVVKRQLDAPALAGGKDLKDADRRSAIELQRRLHIHKNGDDVPFQADMSNLVNVEDLRSASRKMVARVGLEKTEDAKRSLTAGEKRAFEAASLDTSMFDPQILGYEMDCEKLPANMLDLYGVFNVSRSAYKYLKIEDYAAIGAYDCDAKCDAELGPAGNMKWLEGKTFDYRGAFCLQKKTLQEANVDLLGHMMYAAQRSHFINRNRASILGDGINEPQGWLKANVFASKKTQNAAKLDHVDIRRFMSTFPVERGRYSAIMHQNVFGYAASKVDSTGRFIFGDGLMGFTPDDLVDRIRISNWLPDATADNTLGDATFVAGSFVMAIGAWEGAYKIVNKRPMFMEQWLGGTTAWCVKYQFGAEDGGQVACPEDARILVIG